MVEQAIATGEVELMEEMPYSLDTLDILKVFVHFRPPDVALSKGFHFSATRVCLMKFFQYNSPSLRWYNNPGSP